jgi:hypothetical protein
MNLTKQLAKLHSKRIGTKFFIITYFLPRLGSSDHETAPNHVSTNHQPILADLICLSPLETVAEFQDILHQFTDFYFHIPYPLIFSPLASTCLICHHSKQGQKCQIVGARQHKLSNLGREVDVVCLSFRVIAP